MSEIPEQKVKRKSFERDREIRTNFGAGLPPASESLAHRGSSQVNKYIAPALQYIEMKLPSHRVIYTLQQINSVSHDSTVTVVCIDSVNVGGALLWMSLSSGTVQWSDGGSTYSTTHNELNM